MFSGLVADLGWSVKNISGLAVDLGWSVKIFSGLVKDLGWSVKNVFWFSCRSRLEC